MHFGLLVIDQIQFFHFSKFREKLRDVDIPGSRIEIGEKYGLDGLLLLLLLL